MTYELQLSLALVFTRKVYYGYCLRKFRNYIGVFGDAVYTELINQSRPHTTGGLRFSESKCCDVAQKLSENYKSSDSNAERRSLSICRR